MEKEREEALQWFVEFANMDLETIRPGDKAKLLVEVEDFLFPIKEMEEFDLLFRAAIYPLEALGRDKPPPLKRVVPKELAGKMAWAFEELPSKESLEYWTKIGMLQNVVKAELWQHSEMHPDSSKGIHVATGRGMLNREEFLIKKHWGHGKEPFRLTYLPLTQTHGRYIELKLSRLLDGLPSHTVQRCPGCSKYFLNLTLREKRFCSPRCMWRVNTSKRREADREGYNEYQAKLMKDRYREKTGNRRLKTKSRKAKKGE